MIARPLIVTALNYSTLFVVIAQLNIKTKMEIHDEVMNVITIEILFISEVTQILVMYFICESK